MNSKITTETEALQHLKDNLMNLSRELHSIYELMTKNMRDISSSWRDVKYQEFVEGYTPQINKCDEIATRYEQWCSKALQPAIDRTLEYLNSNAR